MIKNGLKIVTISLLLLALSLAFLVSGIVIFHRIGYAITLERDFIERVNRCSRAIRRGGPFNYVEGGLKSRSYRERIQEYMHLNYSPDNHRTISYEELSPLLIELLIEDWAPDYYLKEGYHLCP